MTAPWHPPHRTSDRCTSPSVLGSLRKASGLRVVRECLKVWQHGAVIELCTRAEEQWYFDLLGYFRERRLFDERFSGLATAECA